MNNPRHRLEKFNSVVTSEHVDFPLLSRIANEMIRRVGGAEVLSERFKLLVRDAIDHVIDPIRTARTSLNDLDNVEKTFVGLKVEHFLRDMLDVPKGVRDLVIDGEDVDVKNTVHSTWTIPKETYSEEGPCVLICVADSINRCWLGLMVARDEYLRRGKNRDSKRAVSSFGLQNIFWLVSGESFPASSWSGLDMARFRELRKLHGGTVRAATFFEENVGVIVDRQVVLSLLYDQKDPMKRLRWNGGARDILAPKGIQLLSGAFDREQLTRLGLSSVGINQFIAVRSS